MEPARVAFELDGGVGRLTLTRAPARNAIDRAWVDDLLQAVAACGEAKGVRAVLISAEGPSFSVGGDLKHFGDRLDTLTEELGYMIGGFHTALRNLAELAVPVVCAAQGAIAGGGIGLLWCSDLVLLADDARIATGFAKLGLSGDGGSSWYLPRLVGLQRSLELIVHGRVLDASEAVSWGLASRAVPIAELAPTAEAAVANLACGATVAIGEQRQLVRRALDRDLAGGLNAELDAILRCSLTSDAREGLSAFNERRPPAFEGR